MRTWLLTSIFLVTLHGTQAGALSVTPLQISLAPSGAGASQTVEVSNELEETITVDLSVAERKMDDTGKEKTLKSVEISRSFLIFPPQLILKPKEKRIVRLMWKGTSQVTDELNYRLIVEQLPVAIPRPQDKDLPRTARIRLLMKYLAAVYVTPPGAKPLIEVEPSRGQSGGLRFTVNNKGNQHQILNQFKLNCTSANGGVEIADKDLPSLIGQNVFAHQTRTFLQARSASLNEVPESCRLTVLKQ